MATSCFITGEGPTCSQGCNSCDKNKWHQNYCWKWIDVTRVKACSVNRVSVRPSHYNVGSVFLCWYSSHSPRSFEKWLAIMWYSQLSDLEIIIGVNKYYNSDTELTLNKEKGQFPVILLYTLPYLCLLIIFSAFDASEHHREPTLGPFHIL